MRTYLDCMPCFAQQALDAVSMVTGDPGARLRVMRRVLRAMLDFPLDSSPLRMAAQIHGLIRQETGDPDPYREVKEQANAFALGMLPRLVERARKSSDPFETALRMAIAGNIMDWGARHHIQLSERLVGETIEQTSRAPIEGCSAEGLRQELQAAGPVLYLADNAGEIVFDSLFISFMPCEGITVAVKGGPTINDATMADAEQVGLGTQVRVVSTGSDMPGTVLEDCSDEFRQEFASADLIIAKGQANYEALSEQGGPIYFLLRAKCPVIARDIGCAVGDTLLLRPRTGASAPAAPAKGVGQHARL
jgi:uncharacterized protein with ATP-grasp and redox domains